MLLPMYLVVTPLKGARAHWSLFVPNVDSAEKPPMEAVGKCLHALGQPMTGYNFAIEDNLDYAMTKRNSFYIIGYISSSQLVHPISNNGQKVIRWDTFNPNDTLEKAAYAIPIPRALPVQYVSGLPSAVREKLAKTYDDPNTRRCHEWTFELVTRLVQSHLLRGNPLATLKQVTDAETEELANMYNWPIQYLTQKWPGLPVEV